MKSEILEAVFVAVSILAAVAGHVWQTAQPVRLEFLAGSNEFRPLLEVRISLPSLK